MFFMKNFKAPNFGMQPYYLILLKLKIVLDKW